MARPGAERTRLVRQFTRHASAHGWRDAIRHARRQGGAAPVVTDAYADWCAAHTPDAAALAAMREASARLAFQPLVTIVTPVYNTAPAWLEACADSVIAQAYPRWQWSIGNDGSTSRSTLDALARIAARDPRIIVSDAAQNGGIAAATNLALTKAEGDYVALMDSDDALLPHALYRIVEHLNRPGDRADVLYSDEDKLDLDGRRCEAYFKPDWSPDLFLSNMYVCHLLVARRALVEAVGGFRTAFDFSQDYDLMLRLSERANRVDHVADILYHWRKVPQSGATMGDAKPAAHIAGRAAIADALRRRGVEGEVVDAGPAGFYRVCYRLPSSLRVSIVGAPAGPAATVPAVRAGITVERVATVAEATGDVLVFIGAEVAPATPDWLEPLLEVATQPGVGVVAPRLLDTRGLVREVGLTLGGATLASRHLAGVPPSHGGYFGSGLAIRNVSAVGGGCLVTPRQVWQAAGGWDDGLIGEDSRALDYCLRVRNRGHRVLVTPWSSMTAPAASPAVGVSAADDARLRARWGATLAADPYTNPHLAWPGLSAMA